MYRMRWVRPAFSRGLEARLEARLHSADGSSDACPGWHGPSVPDMAKPSPLLARHMLRRVLRHLDSTLSNAGKDRWAASSAAAVSRLQQNLSGDGHSERGPARVPGSYGEEEEERRVGGDGRSRGWGQLGVRDWESGRLVRLGVLGSSGLGRRELGFNSGRIAHGFAAKAGDSEPGSEAEAVASGGGSGTDMTGVVETFKEGMETATETLAGVGAEVWSLSKEAADTLGPAISDWLQSSPYLLDNIIPAGGSIVLLFSAWLFLPSVLRGIHSYTEKNKQGPARLLGRSASVVPYCLSVFGALESPARMYLTVVTLSSLAGVVAPTSVAAEHLAQIWRGGFVVAVVWFLHNWKRNALKRYLANESLSKAEKEQYETLDTLSSVALFLLAGMALAEACGVAVQSVLTVGGIGGVATAFAAKDLLNNMLSGSALQFGKPFSVGDTIKAGSVEGKVLEIGLHSTQLLTAYKSILTVPNSFLYSQVIDNRSRFQWWWLSEKFPLLSQDFDKIKFLKVTEEIETFLRNHPKIYLGEEEPECLVSTISGSSFVLTISCKVKPMKKEEFGKVKQEIIMEAGDIITGAGLHIGMLT